MKRRMVGVVAALLVAVSVAKGAGKVGPWDLDSLFEAPKWQKSELAPKPGLTGLLYYSLPYLGQPTQVFAYYSAPQGPVPEGGWPAIVCVHGGGGTAFDFWVKAWNEHGYAAISMDLEGHLPLAATNGEKRRQPTPNPGPSRVGVFGDFAKPLDQQWYYHAVAQVICAHSLLGSFPEVNADKIGVTGVSWGGTLTSTVMGVDYRYKFAIPGYGCGFLSESSGHQGRTIKSGEHTEVVDTYYDGSVYFKNVSYPTLWVNGMNDYHFAMPATQKSAQAVNGPATMRFELGMKHGHGPVIRTEECYIFADSVIKGGTPLAKLSRPTAQGNVARVAFTSAAKLKSAKLLYTTDAESIWPDKKWRETEATIGSNEVSGILPPGTFACCFAVTDERDAMVSSEFLQHTVAGAEPVDPAASSDEVDFDALFKAAASAPGARVIIADDFENGISDSVSSILNLKDPAGKAGIIEWYDQVASGGKSLQITNASTVEQPHQPCLSQWLRGAQTITNGTINISFDLFIPSEGGNAFSVILRDYTTKPSVNHITMNCSGQKVSVNGTKQEVAKDQWVHYTLSLPVGVADAKINATMTDVEHGTNTIELPVKADVVEAISWVGLMLPGKSEGKVYIDNLVVTVVK